MDVFPGSVAFLVGKIGMGEDKNGIASAPRRTIFASSSTKTTHWSLWLFGQLGYLSRIGFLVWKNLWHRWRGVNNSVTELQQLWWNSVKECQREDGTMRRIQWYVYLSRNTRGFKNKNVQPGLCANKKESKKLAGQNMYQETLHYCTH